MPANVSLQPNQWCNFPLQGFAQDGTTPEPIHGTLKVSDYTKAYVVISSGLGCVVPKVAAPQGGSFEVTITMDATDAATGTPLPEVDLTVEVFGAPAPSQVAFSAAFGTASIVTGIDSHTPGDPGSDTVTF
jgi:hypothetical protein